MFTYAPDYRDLPTPELGIVESVLELRFPQDGSPEHSAQEISDMFGVSVSRIGQIEANAFQKLRKMKSAKYVKLWLSRGQRALVEKQASAPEYVCWQEEQNEGS